MSAVQTSRLNRLLRPLVSPPIFDFWVGKLSPTLSWDRVLARVVERRVEARDSVTLVLQANRNFQGFVPGQHLNVTAEVTGRRVTRSYSLSDIPRADGRVAITIKQVPGGKLSTQLCQHTRPGDVLELGAAFGEMTLPEEPQQPLLLLAAGSGITPLMSLCRALAAAGMTTETTLVYWAKTREELCFVQELKVLATQSPRFKLQLVLTREDVLETGELQGRPSAGLVAKLAADLAQTTVYACGPAGFVQSLTELLADRALSFAAEAFTPAVLPAIAAGTVRVHLRSSKRVLELPAGQPLLAALEAQGLNPSYGCRMGICNTCACGKLSGSSQNLNSGVLSGEPESALKLCISAARSDLTLDL